MSLDNSHLNVYTQCSLFTSYVCTVVTHNSYVCTVVTMKGRASAALGNLRQSDLGNGPVEQSEIGPHTLTLLCLMFRFYRSEVGISIKIRLSWTVPLSF